jgi:hypothetical protein
MKGLWIKRDNEPFVWLLGRSDGSPGEEADVSDTILTAEEVLLRQQDPTRDGLFALADSHEALRAQVVALQEACDFKQAVLRAADVDGLHFERVSLSA